jgi:hypothetical protein
MDDTSGIAEIRRGSVEINTVVYISALEESERGSSRRLKEDLAPLARGSDGLYFHYFDAESAEALGRYLAFLAARARTNRWRPLIHIDAHGDEHAGLRVGRDEFVSWGELVAAFRAINAETENNLIVALAACEAFHLIKNISLFDKAPFYILLAPKQVVSAGLLEDRFRKFYTKVLTSSDLTAARELLGHEFGYFHAERILAISIARYLRSHGTGKGLARRKEDLLTQLLDLLEQDERASLGTHRKHIRRTIKPVESALLTQLIQRFLFDRQMAISLDELMKRALEAN